MGSGFGTFGREVASDTRGPPFEASNRKCKILKENKSLLITVEKTKIKKWPGIAL